MIKADVRLDAKGLSCPMPIVKTKKAMNNLVDGQILEVQATDKGSKADLPAWSESVGHQYIGVAEENGVLFHYLRKCSDDTVVEKIHEQIISIEEMEKGIGNGALILDVREEAEYAFGHIDGAKSIPMGELASRMDTASASVQASEYLNRYVAYINPEGDGDLSIWFEVQGTKTMDEIGVLSIRLQERADSSSTWTTIETYSHNDYPGLLGYDTNFYHSSVDYSGREGYSYRAYLTVWAGLDGDGDSRVILTDIVVV